MGSWRFRRSVKLAPGVRLNVSKRGVGLAAGPRGARVSAHSRGVVTRTVGIPGTGLHWRDDRRAGGRRRAAPPATRPFRGPAPAATPAAGPAGAAGAASPVDAHVLLGRARAVRTDTVPVAALIHAAAETDLPGLLGLLDDPEVGPAAAAAATLLAVEQGRYDLAAHLARGDLQAELDHPLTVRLLHGEPVHHPIVPGRSVPVPAPLAVLLGGLAAANRRGDHGRVLELTAPVDARDLATAALTLERARALLGAGNPHAALEALAPLARRSSLGPTVRAAGYELRVIAFLATDDRARARQDAGRIDGLDAAWPTRTTLAALVAA